MQSEDNWPLGGADDEGHLQRVGNRALIMLLVLTGAFVTTVLSGGREYLKFTAWILLPAGLGTLAALRILRHPERVGRIQTGNEFDGIIADRGVHLKAGAEEKTTAERRLAVLDALDSARRQRGSVWIRVVGKFAGALGTLGWLAAAIASVVMGHDLAAAGVSTVGCAGFGALTLHLFRLDRRLEVAECILEEQLLSLDGHGIEPYESIGLPSERGEFREWI